MITVHDPNMINFDTNGFGVLLASEAVVTEELNGIFELKLKCYADITGNKTWEYLQEHFIIKARTPRGFQAFRVYHVSKNEKNIITANARHIFYDNLYNSIVGEFKLEEATADTAIKTVFRNAYEPTKFTALATVAKRSDITFKNCNLVEAILDTNGIIKTFGGELFRSNHNIQLQKEIGTDRGFVIKYGKNLKGLDVEINTDELITRIVPIGNDKDGNLFYLPEMHIDSPKINSYFMKFMLVQEFRDIRAGYGNYMTFESVYEALRSRAKEIFESGADAPKINAKVDFELLQNTSEYKNFAHLESVNLGDIVTLSHEKLNINTKAKCVKYVYDAILAKYKKIEIGDFREDLALSFRRKESAEISALSKMITSHAHTGEDGTIQVNYSNVIGRPNTNNIKN